MFESVWIFLWGSTFSVHQCIASKVVRRLDDFFHSKSRLVLQINPVSAFELTVFTTANISIACDGLTYRKRNATNTMVISLFSFSWLNDTNSMDQKISNKNFSNFKNNCNPSQNIWNTSKISTHFLSWSTRPPVQCWIMKNFCRFWSTLDSATLDHFFLPTDHDQWAFASMVDIKKRHNKAISQTKYYCQ